MRKSVPFVLALFFTPFAVNAQRSGGHAVAPAASAFRPAAVAPAVHTAQTAPVTGVAPARPRLRYVGGGRLAAFSRATSRTFNSARTPAKLQSARSNPVFAGTPAAENSLGVPGLGFDYAHYAAMHPHAGRHHLGGGVVPFVGGGIYVPFPYYMEGEAPADSTAENSSTETEPPAPEEDVAESQPEVAVSSHAVSSAPAEEPDSGYVFVRRDGTVFFAVAFTFDSTNLRYVTQDGFRKITPLASLDLVATQQFNEQRGLSPRLPS